MHTKYDSGAIHPRCNVSSSFIQYKTVVYLSYMGNILVDGDLSTECTKIQKQVYWHFPPGIIWAPIRYKDDIRPV